MIKRPRGTDDLLPDGVPRWRRFEAVAREIFERFGYREIRTPHFEATELFLRGIGEGTDIVNKEMFTFTRGPEGRQESFTLRPELTAPIVRAYLEAGLAKSAPFQKLYAIGPNFRAERPAAGRRRQFWQVGVEAFGVTDPRVDAETVVLMDRLFKALGLVEFHFEYNAIGLREDEHREGYRKALREYLEPHREKLSPESQQRLERNLLRILDSKSPADREILADAPRLSDHIGPTEKAYVEEIAEHLSKAGVAARPNPNLVRGFDYYTHFVYECVHTGLDAAQNALGGGGRYNDLVAELGGPPTGAVGFGVGVDRTLLAIEAEGKLDSFEASAIPRLDAYLVCQDPAVRATGFEMLIRLREAGLAIDGDFEDRSFKAQMRQAGRCGARWALIVGQREAENDEAAVKNLADGQQTTVKVDEILKHIRN